MKITASKLFELFQLDEKIRGVAPLVDFLNGSLEQIIKALQGRLTLRDNAFTEIRELSFEGTTSGPRSQNFTPSQRTVEGIVLLQSQSNSGNTVTSWQWEFLNSGAIKITLYPREQLSNEPMTVKFAILFQ